jgi:tRNA(His) guanylyltransferase
MSTNDALGDRMKAYENASRYTMPRRSYTIVRVDGRHFHSLLRNAERPFDWAVLDLMKGVTQELCMDLSGARVAYTQSDEVSILLTDFDTVQTEPHFGGVVQKIASTAAATATMAWHLGLEDQPAREEWKGATFDARVFQIPDQVEVVNYFLWRQRDCARNALQMVARSFWSANEIKGLGRAALLDKLSAEKGVLFKYDYTPSLRMGRVTSKDAITLRWYTESARPIQADPLNYFTKYVPAPTQFEEAKPKPLKMRRVFPGWCRCGDNNICAGHDEPELHWRTQHMETLDQPAPHPHRWGGPAPIRIAENPDLKEPYL